MIIFQPGDVFAGRFRLEQRIGQGGMGQVWRATQLGLQREVALKLILPSVNDDERFREMFLAEARVSGRLSHPNIVPVVDYGEHDGGVLWLVQIFVHGTDLGKVLERSPQGLPVPLAGFIIEQILQGIQAAHDGGVIHRDLKPGNVLVSHTGDIRITDFGIAKVVKQDHTPSVSTALKGSPGYLAPELLRGQAPRFASDLFAVGGLFFELLTGRHPFIGGTFYERDQIFYATLHETIPPLGIDAPPGIEALVHKLLARDLTQRYATAAQVLDDLHAALAPVARDATALGLRRFLAATRETLIAPEPSPPASLRTTGMSGQLATSPSLSGSPPPPRRWRVVAMLTAATLVLAGAGTLVAVSRAPATRSPAQAPPLPQPAAAPAPVPEAPRAAPAVSPDAGVAATSADAGTSGPPAHAAPEKRRRPRDDGDWILPRGGSSDAVKVHR